MRRKTSKGYFKEICKNINSYEFSDEFKKGKKQIEKDLERVKMEMKDNKEIIESLLYAREQVINVTLLKHFIEIVIDDAASGVITKEAFSRILKNINEYIVHRVSHISGIIDKIIDTLRGRRENDKR